jgi:methionyl-tRNA synthetase
MPKTFYISTPIYYVNAPPHMGHAYTDIVADVLARYHRTLGDDVFFLTGTDEHGAKIARAAEKNKEEVENFVRREREAFKKLVSTINLSNSDFIATSDRERHFPGATKLWKLLEQSGDIYKDSYEGLYCLGHEAFVMEKDLVDGKCVDHEETPQLLKEENYFFRLSKYSEEIKKQIISERLIILPKERQNEILSLLDEGLKDVSFSRPSKDISWGVPVPGDQTQTMYVWCDALANYISALGYGGEEANFIKYWPANVHVLGKDILRFHAAIWPAMLLSAKLPLPRTILVHGLIQAGGRKMSKTLGNVIDPFHIIEKYGADAFRYYLTREIPIFNDGEFTTEKFHEAYEANLVNGLGNYVRRVSTMVRDYFENKLERPSESVIASVPMKESAVDFLKLEDGAPRKVEYFSIPYVVERMVWPKYHEAMEAYELNRAADVVFSLLKKLDRYVEDYKPFKLIKEDKEKARAVLWNLSFGTAALAKMLSPFLPETSDKIFKILGITDPKESEFGSFQFMEHPPLFPRKE